MPGLTKLAQAAGIPAAQRLMPGYTPSPYSPAGALTAKYYLPNWKPPTFWDRSVGRMGPLTRMALYVDPRTAVPLGIGETINNFYRGNVQGGLADAAWTVASLIPGAKLLKPAVRPSIWARMGQTGLRAGKGLAGMAGKAVAIEGGIRGNDIDPYGVAKPRLPSGWRGLAIKALGMGNEFEKDSEYVTIGDIVASILADPLLSSYDKEKAIDAIYRAHGSDSDRFVDTDNIKRILTAALGWAMTRALGMGHLGQLAGATVGYGFGSRTRPHNPFPGLRSVV